MKVTYDDHDRWDADDDVRMYTVVRDHKFFHDTFSVESQYVLHIYDKIAQFWMHFYYQSRSEAIKFAHNYSDTHKAKFDAPAYPAQFAEFDAIIADIAALHRRKAADYGAEPIADTGLDGVLIRMTDKLHRARRLSAAWADGAAVSDETIEDTLQDLASYAIIAVVLLRGKWGK